MAEARERGAACVAVVSVLVERILTVLCCLCKHVPELIGYAENTVSVTRESSWPTLLWSSWLELELLTT